MSRRASLSAVREFVEGFFQKIAPVVVRTVQKSFPDPSKATQEEARYRTNWCYDLVKILFHDLHWSIFRIRDRLPGLLEQHLRGEKVDLDNERTIWVPPGVSDGNGVSLGG